MPSLACMRWLGLYSLLPGSGQFYTRFCSTELARQTPLVRFSADGKRRQDWRLLFAHPTPNRLRRKDRVLTGTVSTFLHLFLVAIAWKSSTLEPSRYKTGRVPATGDREAPSRRPFGDGATPKGAHGGSFQLK
jgi:hypothetical protein